MRGREEGRGRGGGKGREERGRKGGEGEGRGGREGERKEQKGKKSGAYSVLSLSHSGDLEFLLTGAARDLYCNLDKNTFDSEPDQTLARSTCSLYL